MGHGLDIWDVFEIEGAPLGRVHRLLFEFLHDPKFLEWYDWDENYTIADPEDVQEYLLPDLCDIVLEYADNWYEDYNEAKELFQTIRYDTPQDSSRYLKWWLSENGDAITWGNGGKGYAHTEVEWLQWVVDKILVPAGRRLCNQKVEFSSESGDGHIEILQGRIVAYRLNWRIDEVM